MAFRVVFLVPVALACSRDPGPAGSAAGPVSAAASVSAVAPIVAASASAPPAASVSAEQAEAAAWAALRAHSPPKRPLADDCADPRVVLSGRVRADPGVLGRIRQMLVAHRVFEVVETAPSRPRQVELYRTHYGVKLFAQGSPPPEQAVIASCADAETCNVLAALFAELSPRDTPSPVCGMPALQTPWHSPAPRRHYAELSPRALASAP